MRDKTPSARAKRVWQRLQDWYGTRLAQMYGPTPPDDWCELVDRTDNDTVARGLVIIKSKHPEFPPTFPQFEGIMRPEQTNKNSGPSIQEQLCTFAIKIHGRTITNLQLSSPWKFIYREKQGFDAKGKEIKIPECVGVEIPQRDGTSGYRISVDDMRMEQAA